MSYQITKLTYDLYGITDLKNNETHYFFYNRIHWLSKTNYDGVDKDYCKFMLAKKYEREDRSKIKKIFDHEMAELDARQIDIDDKKKVLIQLYNDLNFKGTNEGVENEF